MKHSMLMSVAFIFGITACGAEALDGGSAEEGYQASAPEGRGALGESEDALLNSSALLSNSALLLAPVTPLPATASVFQTSPVVQDGSGDSFELKGKNKCTEDKQLICDACISACDYLCSQPNGGGPGNCTGYLCLNKCGQCQLSCFTSCGKCLPSSFK